MNYVNLCRDPTLNGSVLQNVAIKIAVFLYFESAFDVKNSEAS